ncbi:MAG TPA: SPOR domain-containing protein [Rhodocyclaceae bacterium]|mgnify:FL=1|nr:SPOR domain-containing protein [Rhodocyclaceae bacterium]
MNAKPVLTLTLNRSHRIATPHMSRGGTLLGIFLGLLIGLLCAFGVIWYLNKTPLPFLDKTARPEKSDKPVGEASQQAVQPQQLPGKPGDKVINGSNEKPRFEFYKILPGAQEATPGTVAGDAKPVAAVTPQDGQSAPVEEVFYLQAGAFHKPAEADNMKAKLALMGVETSVQETNMPDKSLMYRVRVGPYTKPEEMNRVRTLLAQNGIQASMAKTRPIVPTP